MNSSKTPKYKEQISSKKVTENENNNKAKFYQISFIIKMKKVFVYGILMRDFIPQTRLRYRIDSQI
jgi:hypothetical protein